MLPILLNSNNRLSLSLMLFLLKPRYSRLRFYSINLLNAPTDSAVIALSYKSRYFNFVSGVARIFAASYLTRASPRLEDLRMRLVRVGLSSPVTNACWIG
jgi:hypothetical protein